MIDGVHAVWVAEILAHWQPVNGAMYCHRAESDAVAANSRSNIHTTAPLLFEPFTKHERREARLPDRDVTQ